MSTVAFQASGNFHPYIHTGVIVYDSAVPGCFSIQKNNQPVIDMPDIDPILISHNDCGFVLKKILCKINIVRKQPVDEN